MARALVSNAERETLYEKLRTDSSFRDKMKKNWRKAFKDIGIDAKELEGKQLKGHEVLPMDNKTIASSIIITITVAADEEISIDDSVVFSRK